MSGYKSNMLENFVRLLTQQIDKYTSYSENEEYIEKLFDGLGRACVALKRVIGVEEVAKYERIKAELREIYQKKKDELLS